MTSYVSFDREYYKKLFNETFKYLDIPICRSIYSRYKNIGPYIDNCINNVFSTIDDKWLVTHSPNGDLSSLFNFYNTLIQENVMCIVNLSSIEDLKKNKTFNYIPDINIKKTLFKYPFNINNNKILIETLSKENNIEHGLDIYTIKVSLYEPVDRDIGITDYNMAISKIIKVFHYKCWIDNSIISIKYLKKLIDITNEYINKTVGKCLVHCSAGIGRSGTFLAAYYIVKNNITEYQQIIDIIINLRKKRMHMVQKEEQFVLLMSLCDYYKKFMTKTI